MKILRNSRGAKMIRSIELVDFLAHSNTKLEFDSGATVFVGDNGAGKSSIIDAIIFSLFGESRFGKKIRKD
uniref:SMC domain-containing protein (SbcC) n=1 Tax=uncultured marine thaumarchaeote KM3_128_G11 TaxID=1455996 RepID=A0A075GDE2_9ARCH|nr:SMC domain-containing protein (sbcC) [uncultured marine thaumarchaeote KM3_128_G11]